MSHTAPTTGTRQLRIRGALALVAIAAVIAAGCSGPGSTRRAASTGSGPPPAVGVAADAVFDVQTSTMMATDDADARLPVGSLLKLLNAVVAYAAGQPDRSVVAPDGLAGGDGESVIGISEGQVLSRSVLIRAMLKVSANDAARLLALDIAGSEPAYATMMNDAAATLQLTETHAANATGLDADGQFSSARDLITLATVLSANADFRRTVTEATAHFDGRTFPNTNDLLTTYQGADGIKTGHTTDAGYCLLAAATRHGRRIIVVVLGASSDRARDDAAASLLDWAFAHGPVAGGRQPR